MSDEALRELARDPSPAGRLRLARALERLGRRDEALEALLPAREDAAVRRALGEFPAWVHEGGTPGNARAIDVAPLTRAPRVKWQVRGTLDPNRQERLALQFIANPIVVVASISATRAVVLDAESGRGLWELTHGEHLRDSRVCLVGDVLLVPIGERLSAYDCFTGERLWERAIPGLLELHGSVVLARRGETFDAFELGSARAMPDLRWSMPVPFPENFRLNDRVLTTSRYLLVRVETPSTFRAVDRATGRIRWTAQPAAFVLRADDDGALALGHPGRVMFSRDGRKAWSSSQGGNVVALGERRVVCDDGTILDRSTARAIKRPRTTLPRVLAVRALARDTIYEATLGERPLLRMRTPDGELVWEQPSEPGREPYELVPAHERLYTYGRDGTVTCYEEPS